MTLFSVRAFSVVTLVKALNICAWLVPIDQADVRKRVKLLVSYSQAQLLTTYCSSCALSTTFIS